MNRGEKENSVCSLSFYNLFPELSEMKVALPSGVVLWRLHLQLICSLSLFCPAFSCFDNLVSYCPLVWCILVFDWFPKDMILKCFWVKFQNGQQVEFVEELISHCMYSIPKILDKLCPTCCGYNRERSMKFVLLPTYQCDKLCPTCCGYNRERSMKFILLPTYQFTTDILNSETE